MLRPEPVLSIEAGCAAASDVDLVGPVRDVFRRDDHERRRMCVISHSNNLQHSRVNTRRRTSAAASHGLSVRDAVASANLALRVHLRIDDVQAVARHVGATPAQIALARLTCTPLLAQ